MKSVGIVLAAGASQRMGSPKSLLCGADGIPLAVQQAAFLKEGGCSSAVVVLGSGMEHIRHRLPADLWTVDNPRWAEGRATSLQAGLRAAPDADGWLVLPVDAVGVQLETIRRLLAAAGKEPQAVWRPVYHGAKGNLLWIPRQLRGDLTQLSPAARVDEWVRPIAHEMEVDDPCILRNVNTPEAWKAWLQESQKH